MEGVEIVKVAVPEASAGTVWTVVQLPDCNEADSWSWIDCPGEAPVTCNWSCLFCRFGLPIVGDFAGTPPPVTMVKLRSLETPANATMSGMVFVSKAPRWKYRRLAP